MAKGYFITGTDTGIGKTRTTLALLEYFKRQAKVVLGMKPVASGCMLVDGRLKNEDALLIQKHASNRIPYELINPYAFELPVSPHLAANKSGTVIDIQRIQLAYQKLEQQSEVVIVEGVGGWLVPLNQKQAVSDLASLLDLPVIVVVGIRLGCINQARLTFSELKRSGVQCLGWIASCVQQDMLMQEENIETLSYCLDIPLLAVLPYEKELNTNYFSQQIKDKL